MRKLFTKRASVLEVDFDPEFNRAAEGVNLSYILVAHQMRNYGLYIN